MRDKNRLTISNSNNSTLRIHLFTNSQCLMSLSQEGLLIIFHNLKTCLKFSIITAQSQLCVLTQISKNSWVLKIKGIEVNVKIQFSNKKNKL